LETRPLLVPLVARCAGVAAAAGSLLFGVSLLELPHLVPRLTVVNDSDYQVEVEVSRPARDGWVDLGAVDPRSQKASEETFDQGRDWVLRFSYGGLDAGELAVSRSDLIANQWKIAIPPAVAERLGGAGIEPSAH